jgi:hypothetical protein
MFSGMQYFLVFPTVTTSSGDTSRSKHTPVSLRILQNWSNTKGMIRQQVVWNLFSLVQQCVEMD